MYDEESGRPSEPYIITELMSEDSSPNRNFKTTNLNKPLVNSTSPSPQASNRVVIPPKIQQRSGAYPTLSNLLTSMHIDSSQTNKNIGNKGQGTIQKLFGDWNNLLDDSVGDELPVAASVEQNTVTFGAVNKLPQGKASNFKQNIRQQPAQPNEVGRYILHSEFSLFCRV